ncbi:MAG: sugar transferase [Cyanobacteria bacterium SBLK]|nr:sugar transferase [Cyanobacteria bacterium SBLK]
MTYVPESLDSPLNEPKTLLKIHPSVSHPIKRGIDILGALVGLILTGAIAIPIAIALYFTSPGSLFYSQIRCGFNGKTFRLWKFRSMITDADRLKHLVKNQADGFIFKNENDPRITPVGKFLRRTSLDEFPQFWNVLKGEMSLVGTRPPTPDEVEKYSEYHWQRLQVKPGLTGEWQVNGRSSVKNFNDIVKMDLDYQEKWSIGYDLQLIFRTFGVILSKKGAY